MGRNHLLCEVNNALFIVSLRLQLVERYIAIGDDDSMRRCLDDIRVAMDRIQRSAETHVCNAAIEPNESK